MIQRFSTQDLPFVASPYDMKKFSKIYFDSFRTTMMRMMKICSEAGNVKTYP